MSSYHEVHTPEGLELRMPLAGVGSRMMAGMVDVLLLSLVWIGFALAGVAGVGSFDALSSVGLALLVLCIFLSFWGYGIFWEILMQGRTPGKRAMGLRVLKENGLPLGLREIVLRNLLRMADLQPGLSYGVGVVWMFFDKKGRRLGDLVAGTVVVRDALVTSKNTRVGAAWAARAEEGHAQRGVKLAGGTVKARQLDLIEQYLLRLPSLPPEKGYELAERLLGPLLPLLDESMVRQAETQPIKVLRQIQELGQEAYEKPAAKSQVARRSLF